MLTSVIKSYGFNYFDRMMNQCLLNLRVSGCRGKVRSCAAELGLCSGFTQTVPDDVAGGI